MAPKSLLFDSFSSLLLSATFPFLLSVAQGSKLPFLPTFSLSNTSIQRIVNETISHHIYLRNFIDGNTNSSDTQTFHNTVWPLEFESQSSTYDTCILESIATFSSNSVLRQLCTQGLAKINQLTGVKSWPINFARKVLSINGSDPTSRLSSPHPLQDNKLLTHVHRIMKQAGLHLPNDTQRDALRELDDRINQLTHNFTTMFTLPITYSEYSPKNFSYFYTPWHATHPSSPNLSSLVNDTSLQRKLIHRQMNEICKQNLESLHNIAMARNQLADKMGYKNFLDFALEGQTIGGIPQLYNLLTNMTQLLHPFRLKKLGQLEKQPLSQSTQISYPYSAHNDLNIWDIPRLFHPPKPSPPRPDGLTFEQFYPFRHTRDKIMLLFSEFLGLNITLLDKTTRSTLSHNAKSSKPSEDLVWSPHVDIFAISSDTKNDKRFLGYLYMDYNSTDNSDDGTFNSVQVRTIRPGFSVSRDKWSPSIVAIIVPYTMNTDFTTLLDYRKLQSLLRGTAKALINILSKGQYQYFRRIPVNDITDSAVYSVLEFWCKNIAVQIKLSTHVSTIDGEAKRQWYAELTPEQRTKIDQNELPPKTIPPRLVQIKSSTEFPEIFAFTESLSRALVALMMYDSSTFDVDLSELPQAWKNHREFSMFIEPREDSYDSELPGDYTYACFAELAGPGILEFYHELWGTIIAAEIYHVSFSYDSLNRTLGLDFRTKIIENIHHPEIMTYINEYIGHPVTLDGFLYYYRLIH